ncbi:MAG TPA: DinB family protein [Gemmatimonadaceae bacterium]
MILSERRWNAAIAEHETVVREFIAACDRCAPDEWNASPAPGKWSTAAVALHICHAYELGENAMAGGPGMRLRVSPPYAWVLRNLLLPVILATQRFPRGARAPREVVPDLEEARMLTPDAAAARLKRVADEAAAAFRRARRDGSAPLMTHAYFGALTPYVALRTLSAHTRHHARSLLERRQCL